MRKFLILAAFYLVSWSQYELGEWIWWSDEGFCTSGNITAIGCKKFDLQGFQDDIKLVRNKRIIRRKEDEGTVERIYRLLPQEAFDIEIKRLDEKELHKL